MYSQYNEEKVLEKYFGDKKDGVVVDIGAADGIRFSNSYWLLMRKWKGLLIEPNNKNFEKLQKTHKYTENVIMINEAAGSQTIKDSTIYCDMNDRHEQLSTLSNDQAERCKDYFKCDFYEQKIDITKTSELFERYELDKIDFLSIDTEMWDYEVLKGIDYDKVDISLICVEHNNEDIEMLLIKNDYQYYDKTIGNVFYEKIY